MQAAAKMTTPALEPFALKDAPSLIERVFPAQKISAEAQKERKANLGQTLTALGSYWKGRKPLIMVRAIVLGCLLPVTENLEADLHIFELLMAIDDAAFGRREPKLKVSELAERLTLKDPWDFFDYTIKNRAYDAADIESMHFPLNLAEYPALTLRWKRNLDSVQKATLLANAMQGMAYEEKVAVAKRPEELDPEMLYGPIWGEVNAHLAQFGIKAHSHEALVEQLGILRYGHRPRVGDTFCGGGSIPFEAARLGCDVYASDLNPVACMLTWGALNIIGASPQKRAELEKAQQEVAEAVDHEITELGIEHNERGDRAKAFLYCLETRCPETGWMVPMLPNLIISSDRKVYAQLTPNHTLKKFDIDIISDASKAEMKAANKGTIQDGHLTYELNGKIYRTSIKTIRGDHKDEFGENKNRLRQWEGQDYSPRSGDIFQERLYCVQWITKESWGVSRQETYFSAVTEEDVKREKKIEEILDKNFSTWQESGLLPDMAIEPGIKTDEPIRTRGWRYWHQLFNARQLLNLAILRKKSGENAYGTALLVAFAKTLDRSAKLCQWSSTPAQDIPLRVFVNQALNTLSNWGVRASSSFIAVLYLMRYILIPTSFVS